MNDFVVLAVLAGALCHASWNTLVKRASRYDPFKAIVLTSGFSGLFALPLLLWFGLPDKASWLLLAYGVAFQLPYYLTISKAYEAGDVSQAYPIARGSAAFFAVMASLVVSVDVMDARLIAGLLLLCVGIAALAWQRTDAARPLNVTTVKYALLTGLIIATYSLINGVGVRRSGNPIGYAAMFFVAEGLTIVTCGFVLRGRALFDDIDLGPRGVMGSGALAFTSYAIALWASTILPIAAVAALRESSVLFAAGLAVLILGERLYPARVIGALLVFGGLAIAKSG